jgi:hypothetical protein
MELQELTNIIPFIKEYGFSTILSVLLLYIINKVFSKIFIEYINYNREMLKEKNNHLKSTNLLAEHLDVLSTKIPEAVSKMNFDIISLKNEIGLISEDLKKVVSTEHFNTSTEMLHQALLKINDKLDKLIK